MQAKNLGLAMWLLALNLAVQTATAQTARLETAVVRQNLAAQMYQAEAVTEAVRQSQIAAQVAGAILDMPVKAGEHVRKGQVLVRMDARAAVQEANASRAQVEAARAAMQVAQKDYDRQKQLFAKNYISQAQMERAEAQLRASTAQANAQIAQAGSAQTQSGFYTLNAPYDGVLAETPAMPGDMVMPGKLLISMYDPAAMRVAANIPQSQIALLDTGRKALLDIPGLPEAQRRLTAANITVLPAADAATHTVVVRFDLPAGIAGLTPGMFARVAMPVRPAPGQLQAGSAARLYIPKQAVFRRAELSAVYVVRHDGTVLLRQVRTGPQSGDEIEILSGVAAGEQVALDAVKAAALTIPATRKP